MCAVCSGLLWGPRWPSSAHSPGNTGRPLALIETFNKHASWELDRATGLSTQQTEGTEESTVGKYALSNGGCLRRALVGLQGFH